MAAPKKAGRSAGKTPAQAANVNNNRRTPVIVRFMPDMLQEIDAAARRNGLSRSAWVAMAARAKLDESR
jgi:hypothetical protein